MSKSRATTRHLRVEQSQGVYIHDLKLVDAPMYSLTILSSSAVEIGYVSVVAADQVWHCNFDHSCKPDTCRERLMESASPVHKFTYITFRSRIEMSVSVSRTQRKTFWWRISCVIKVGPWALVHFKTRRPSRTYISDESNYIDVCPSCMQWSGTDVDSDCSNFAEAMSICKRKLPPPAHSASSKLLGLCP